MSYQSILESASKFQLVEKEREVARWLRGYEVPELTERYAVENAALRVVLDLAALAGGRFEADGHTDAIVNALGRVLGNSHRADAEYSTSYFGSLAALTFASAGNFPSARVLASSLLDGPDLGIAERWMMRVLSHRRIELSHASVPNILRSYAQLTDHALASGYREDFDGARAEFLRANKEDAEALTSSDRGLRLLWEQVHARLEELSVGRVLRDVGFAHQAYASRLLESSSLFYPSQVHALLNYPVIQRGEPVVISLPTSTGKTLLGELALVSSLTWQPVEHWLAIYVAPYRALTTQIMQDMRRRLLAAEIWCDMRRGGYLSEAPLRPGHPTVLVATPEAFDGLLRRRQELYSTLSGCVFDEFHLIEQQQRGVRYEGLLGRLLRGTSGEADWPKIVALSPVVEETQAIRSWLGTDAVVRNEWIPTSRRVGVLGHDAVIEYYTPEEKLPHDSEVQVVWRGQLPISGVSVTSVALDQFRRFDEEPVLIVANTRRSTRALALELRLSLSHRPLSESDPASHLSREIIRRYPYLRTLPECLIYGVAYHNAALPSWVRGKLEELIKDKQLRFVVSTTTLAEGVDFPFRVVVLEDWSSFWQFGRRQPMSRLLVKNIAGRGGRAWAYTEGDTVLIERHAEATARELYIEPATYKLKSSVQRALETDSADQSNILLDSWAVVESQFIAFLSVTDDKENVEEAFTASLYAAQDGDVGRQITSVTSRLVDDSVSEPLPVIQKQSPLALTDFGQTVLQTGLSPRSGMALAGLVRDYEPIQASKEGSRRRPRYGIQWIPLIAAIWKALLEQPATWIRELRAYRFRQIGRHQFPVRVVDFNETAMAWASGVPIEAIGYLILRDLESISKQEVRAWLNGERSRPPRGFEGWIEKLSNDFCGDYLSRQWSWVFRGGSEVCRYLNESALKSQSFEVASHYQQLSQEFHDLSLRLEFGVSDIEVAQWLREGCPVDRARVDRLKDEYERQGPMFRPEFSEWLGQERDRLTGLQVGPFPQIRILQEDIDRLKGFLRTLAE